jgi:hypothetical protein
MSLSKASIARGLCLVAAGILCLLYSALGLVGVRFFGGGLHSATAVYLVFAPLLVFPLFLVSFISLRWSVLLLWTFLIVDFIWQARGDLRLLASPALVTDSSQMDRWLFLAVILMTAAFIVERRSSSTARPA